MTVVLLRMCIFSMAIAGTSESRILLIAFVKLGSTPIRSNSRSMFSFFTILIFKRDLKWSVIFSPCRPTLDQYNKHFNDMGQWLWFSL